MRVERLQRVLHPSATPREKSDAIERGKAVRTAPRRQRQRSNADGRINTSQTIYVWLGCVSTVKLGDLQGLDTSPSAGK